MAQKRASQGFAVVEILIVVIILAVLIGGGWYVWQAQQHKDAASQQTPEANSQGSPDPEIMWNTYTDEVGKFTIQYPSNWKISTEKLTQGQGDDGPAINYTTITSPSNNTLKIDAAYGGRGGVCEPPHGEVPFRPGNMCPSEEYVYAEKLSPGKQLYTMNYSTMPPTSEKVNLFLVAKRYASPEGKQIYALGLTTSESDSLELKKPRMGYLLDASLFIINDGSNTMYPEVTTLVSADKESFLTSSEGETFKQILRSFTLR